MYIYTRHKLKRFTTRIPTKYTDGCASKENIRKKIIWKDSVAEQRKVEEEREKKKSRTQTLLQFCAAKSLKSCRPQSK